jgi:hypothetical protein
MTATNLRALAAAGLLAFAFSACGDVTKGDESLGSKSIAEQDSDAKSSVRLAATLMETYYTDHETYLGADEQKLVAMEPTMADGAAASLTVSKLSATGYLVAVKSDSGTGFGIEKRDSGEMILGCSEPGTGGCGDAGDW